MVHDLVVVRVSTLRDFVCFTEVKLVEDIVEVQGCKFIYDNIDKATEIISDLNKSKNTIVWTEEGSNYLLKEFFKKNDIENLLSPYYTIYLCTSGFMDYINSKIKFSERFKTIHIGKNHLCEYSYIDTDIVMKNIFDINFEINGKTKVLQCVSENKKDRESNCILESVLIANYIIRNHN